MLIYLLYTVVADSSKVEMMLVGLSGSLDCSIKVWNLDSGSYLWSLIRLPGDYILHFV